MILGAILAGGRSSRFGSDKGAALLAGRPLIDHAAAVLQPRVHDIVLCGRSRVGWTCLDDRPGPGLGPLGGISGALHHAAQGGYTSVMTIACDMPIIPAELILALTRACPSYCADAPTLGHWPVDAAAALEARLAMLADRSVPTGPKIPGLSIRRWAASIGARPIEAPAPLANINTPADLAAV